MEISEDVWLISQRLLAAMWFIILHQEETHSRATRGVDFDTLLATSDIVSVHAPLTDDTLGLMDKAAFEKMKKSAIFFKSWQGSYSE